MCEKACEIQNIWKPQTGDWTVDKNFYSPFLVCSVKENSLLCYQKRTNSLCHLPKNLLIWLPHSHQLQEMIDLSTNADALLLCEEAKDFIQNYYSLGLFSFCKEMWLSFVMYKKYNKIWSGQEWLEV